MMSIPIMYKSEYKVLYKIFSLIVLLKITVNIRLIK